MKTKCNWKNFFVVAACCSLFITTSAFGVVLSYDGFGTGYAPGSVNGQAYQGTGYAAGAWNTNSTFEAGGLTHPTLQTTPGFYVRRNDGEMSGFMDVTGGGPFAAAGLVDGGGKIGGTTVGGTLYYSFLARDEADNGAGWAGFNLYNDGDENFGLGSGGANTLYNVYHNDTGELGIGTPATNVDGNVHLFVVRVDYNANGKDFYTAYLDPDPALSEGAQSADISVTVGSINDDDNDGWNHLRMRGDNVWHFDEVRFGTTWGDVTPLVIPEPGSILLAAMGLGALGIFLRRRRRR